MKTQTVAARPVEGQLPFRQVSKTLDQPVVPDTYNLKKHRTNQPTTEAQPAHRIQKYRTAKLARTQRSKKLTYSTKLLILFDTNQSLRTLR